MRDEIVSMVRDISSRISRSGVVRHALYGFFSTLLEKFSEDDVVSFLGSVDGGKVLDLTRLESGRNLSGLVVCNRELFEASSRFFLELKDPYLTRGSLGSGEILFTLFGGAKKNTKGDLVIDGIMYELKTSSGGAKRRAGGRFVSGEAPKMISLRKVFHDIGMEVLGVDPEAWRRDLPSINGSGIERFNGITRGIPEDRIREFWYKFLSRAFPTVTTTAKFRHIFDNALSEIPVNPRRNGRFFIGLTKLGYLDCKMVDGFDRVIFLNRDSLNYIIVGDEDELEKNMAEDRIRIVNFSTWKDSQNTLAFQLYNE